MRKFWYVTGELTEVQRYINVPMRWCEQYPSRERRKFWIAADNGNNVKLTVHSHVMPARRGHRVNVLMLGDMVVGLANLTTSRQVNFVQADPPLLVRRCDGLAALGILGVGLAAAVAWDARSLLVAVPAAVPAAARARAIPDAGSAANAGGYLAGDGRCTRSRPGDAAKGQVSGAPGGRSLEWA